MDNSAWLLLPLVGVLLVATMFILSAARSAGRLSAEGARKLFHVAMGLLTMSFPWLFGDAVPVLLLAVLSCVWFEAVRRMTSLQHCCGPVLSAVARPGRGEIHFVMGTALTFIIANGQPLAFCLPMAILALADTAAALIGQRYGSHPGALRLGDKSLAGSSACFVVTLGVSLCGLTIADWTAAAAIPIAMTLAWTTTVLEGIARRGADNLLIPVGAALLLRGAALPAPQPGRIAAVLIIATMTIAAMQVLTAQRQGR